MATTPIIPVDVANKILKKKFPMLLRLVPTSLNYETSITDTADLYMSPSSLDVEYTRWQLKRESVDGKSDSLQKALQVMTNLLNG